MVICSLWIKMCGLIAPYSSKFFFVEFDLFPACCILSIMKQKKAGFTLVELLIVMGVITIMIAAALPSIRAFQREAWTMKAQTDLRTISIAMEAFYKNRSHYPGRNGDWQAELMNEPNPILTNHLYDPFDPRKDSLYKFDHSGWTSMEAKYYIVNTCKMEPHVHWQWESWAAAHHASVNQQGIVTYEGHVIWGGNGHLQ
jgi:prepilin-type N-terminal cleavage/methylation domain-containing protein